jgi:hypothetical protein
LNDWSSALFSGFQRVGINIRIETSHERFTHTNERCADVARGSEEKGYHVVVRRLLPHIEFRAFFPFRGDHAINLTSHRERRGAIEFGFVRIRRFRYVYLFLREKLPRFGAGRSPSAVIIPVCFLAHRCLHEKTVQPQYSGFSGNVKGQR